MGQANKTIRRERTNWMLDWKGGPGGRTTDEGGRTGRIGTVMQKLKKERVLIVLQEVVLH
jgi:hypothetical protein